MPAPRKGLLRRAQLADLPRLFAIRGAVRENRLHEDRERFAAATLAAIGRGLVRVWEDASGIHGYAMSDPELGEIEALYVDPASEGRGIGRALLRKCCDDLMRRGHRHATLVTSPGTRAEQVYRDAGWSEVGLEPSGAIRFRKRLTA